MKPLNEIYGHLGYCTDSIFDILTNALIEKVGIFSLGSLKKK